MKIVHVVKREKISVTEAWRMRMRKGIEGGEEFAFHSAEF